MFSDAIRLPSGRLVEVGELDAGPTYHGILEGGRSSNVHDRIVAGLARRAGSRFPGVPAVVVPPRRVLLPSPAPTGPAREDWLPRVRVMALCRSEAVGPHHFDSHLVAVWLQDDFSISAGSIESRLRAIDWDATARDSSP